MRVNLSFRQTIDERLLVITEVAGDYAPVGIDDFSASVYADENLFLERIILAELTLAETTDVILAVLMALQPSKAGRWVAVDLSVEQLSALGLGEAKRPTDLAALQLTEESNLTLRDGGLADVLLRSPTPFTIVIGANHWIAFMNDAYAQILGIEHAISAIGKPLLKSFPELRDKSCLESLEQVYRSGKSKIGIEVKAKYRPSESDAMQEAHYELSYNPIRDHDGRVCGVMVLATDITEKVLDRQVSASREAQLYRQWAELETIYRTAPLAMCYFDAHEYRIIRANSIQAETMGAPADQLVGKSVLEIFPDMPGLREIFQRVANGERIYDLPFTTDFPIAPGVYRHWRLNYSPVFDEFGRVEMITSIALEILPGSM